MGKTDLLIFGVDGMSNRVREIMGEDLPNLSKIETRTNHGVLKSYVEEGSPYGVPSTGVCWNSLYTGLKAKDHGFTAGGWTEGDAKFHQMYTVFDKLSENNKKLGLCSLPMTYPSKPINQWMISGFVATTLKSLSHKLFCPKELENLVRDDFIEQTATWMAKKVIGSQKGADGVAPDKKTENTYPILKKGEWNRLKEFNKIINSDNYGGTDYDVLAFGTTFADKIGHINGINSEEDWTQKTYKEVDKMLGFLLEATDPEEVMIISDHGFLNYQHDLKGYGLCTFGDRPTNLFGVTPAILNYFGIDYNKTEYGLQEGEDITKKEKENIKDQLRNLGYLE